MDSADFLSTQFGSTVGRIQGRVELLCRLGSSGLEFLGFSLDFLGFPWICLVWPHFSESSAVRVLAMAQKGLKRGLLGSKRRATKRDGVV